jgi:hypothetical protein
MKNGVNVFFLFGRFVTKQPRGELSKIEIKEIIIGFNNICTG